MEQRLMLLICLGLILLIINIGEVEAGQGCPLPVNTCRHHCVYEVKTNKGKPCGGKCRGLTCVCLYGKACRGRRDVFMDDDQSDASD